MSRRQAIASITGWVSAACLAHCGNGSDAPAAQVLVYVDVDAPAASRARAQLESFLADASVDTLRVDILNQDNLVVDTSSFTAPDEALWPVSFGVRADAGRSFVRLRLRAFRAQNSEAAEDPDAGTKVYEPRPEYTIDRVVELPLPRDKGVFAMRVVLRSECRGNRPDFARGRTCVSGARLDGTYREEIEFVPVDQVPARPPMWWPSPGQDCTPGACPDGQVCVPGGFFMLGNARVIGFGALQRYDAVPAHPVSMLPFCIDTTEMTVARFGDLLQDYVPDDSVLAEQQCSWEKTDDQLPMSCVSWWEAQQACTKANGRLPTEAEWEYVATGMGRGILFPWGDQPPTCTDVLLSRTGPMGFGQCNGELIEAAGTHPFDTSPAGVLDLGGSLSEWTFDTFAEYSEGCWQKDGVVKHPACLDKGEFRTIRGGSFATVLELAYSALRGRELADMKRDSIGFRCVTPIQGAAPSTLPLYREDTRKPLTPDPSEPPDAGGGTEPAP